MEKTLVKGLKVLELLARSDEPRGVAELAQELDLTKSNVHRLLQTLAGCGFVSGTEGRYAPTSKMWELGSRIISRVDVKRLAVPAMRELADKTSETVHLSVLDRTEVVYIDKIESEQPIRAYTEVGGRAPAYCVATGKALLAFQPPDVMGRVAKRLQRFTARTITDPEQLAKEMARVRRLGYALNRGEWRDRVLGIAAPIWDSRGQVVAAVGISGPADRLTPTVLRKFTPLVCAAARDVSRRMGATSTQREDSR